MCRFVQSIRSGAVCRLVLNRPDRRNALNRDLLGELRASVQAACEDADIRLLQLTAAGPVFCAGMDLSEMEARATSPTAEEEWLADSRIYADVINAIYTAPVPTIAVVQGPALAGGVGIAAACDLVICESNAYFALPEPMRGIVAAMVTPLLQRRIGPGPTSQMLLANEPCPAETALRNGLCYDVVDQPALEDRLRQLTSRILMAAPTAVALTKQYLQQCQAPTLAEAMQSAIQVSAGARQQPCAREGLQAYLQKRKPSWQEEP